LHIGPVGFRKKKSRKTVSTDILREENIILIRKDGLQEDKAILYSTENARVNKRLCIMEKEKGAGAEVTSHATVA